MPALRQSPRPGHTPCRPNRMKNPSRPYHIGLPEWRHPDWYAEGRNPKEPLKIYARHFSSVEGNSTFYALPTPDTVRNWDDATPPGFRFCFKFPKTVTHDAMLRHCRHDVSQYLDRLAPLEEKLGVLWLQMSSAFGPEDLPRLRHFLVSLPSDYSYGIEVRHPGFFRKDEAERNFNRLLMEHRVNRVMFDTRVLFAHPADDEATQKSLREKPRLPLHVIATGDYPMLRFMSPMNLELSDTALDQWANKTLQWITEGKKPYVFFHTPYKAPVPNLAQRFSEKINKLSPGIAPVALWASQPSQNNLF